MDKLSLNEQLNEYYASNGKEFVCHNAAVNHIKKKGYFWSNGKYRNTAGNIAYLTKIVDSDYNKAGKKTIIPKGWLVTFGGYPISHNELILSHAHKALI